jgi:hypothetical protein
VILSNDKGLIQTAALTPVPLRLEDGEGGQCCSVDKFSVVG